MKLTAKNWDQFQHYKNRQPPWIKLHRDVINSFAWARLQTASKALAPCLWMLASESMDGTVNADVKELAWKFGMTENEVRDGIDGLVKAEFFALESAPNTYMYSNTYTENRERDRERVESALAERLQDASMTLAKVEVIPPREARPTRGSRLAENWVPSDDGVALCRERGLDPQETLDGFRDYWLAVPGARGLKTNWEATWRNWCRNQRSGGKAAARKTPEVSYYVD